MNAPHKIRGTLHGKAKRVLKGVLFDKDDTLLDLATFWLAPVQRTVDFMLRELGRTDETALRHTLECACGFDGDALIAESPVVAGTNADVIGACMDVLIDQGIDVIDRPLFARLAETYLEFACLRDGITQPTGDLAAVLESLHTAGIHTGVATSDSFASTVHALEKLGIADRFDCILTADRVARPKPAPDMAMVFCARCGLTPEEVAMVGDSANDMRFARNAGLTAIYFDRTGNAADIDCDHRITRIEDVLTLF